MHVRFKFDWFGPDCRRYRKCSQVEYREVPDEYRSVLPSTAVVIDGGEAAKMDKEAVEAAEAAKKVDPREEDIALAAAREQERIEREADEAEEKRKQKAEAFQRQLEEEMEARAAQRDTTDKNETPKKRGPGRPPKKRGPGRPRKKG